MGITKKNYYINKYPWFRFKWTIFKLVLYRIIIFISLEICSFQLINKWLVKPARKSTNLINDLYGLRENEKESEKNRTKTG